MDTDPAPPTEPITVEVGPDLRILGLPCGPVTLSHDQGRRLFTQLGHFGTYRDAWASLTLQVAYDAVLGRVDQALAPLRALLRPPELALSFQQRLLALYQEALVEEKAALAASDNDGVYGSLVAWTQATDELLVALGAIWNETAGRYELPKKEPG